MTTNAGGETRPLGVTALATFFLVGAAIAAVTCVSLAFPGGVLEPMWRLNPRAREAFAAMGDAAIVVMAVVSAACAATAVGLARGRRWGHRLAAGVLGINVAADLANAFWGRELRALAGVPIGAALLAYLATGRVRAFFSRPEAAGDDARGRRSVRNSSERPESR